MIARPKRKKTWTGKAGILRYSKKDMDLTRRQIYERALGYCQLREILTQEIRDSNMDRQHKEIAIARIEMGCNRWSSLEFGHDVHLKAKRRHGDSLDNRVWGCPPCHLAGDHNAYGKPCPPKPRQA